MWDILAASATDWVPSNTILLITKPGFRTDRKSKLLINSNTYVDVNPVMYDAELLRQHAQKMSKRDHVNPMFPVNGTLRATTLILPPY